MRALKPILVAAVVAALASPATASSHRTVAGTVGLADGSCLTLTAVADRRWNGAFWAQAQPVVGGVCNETDDHDDFSPNCKIEVRQQGDLPTPADPARLYASWKIGTVTYRLVAVDNGPFSPDDVGLSTVVPRYPDLCGASEVVPQRVASGGFTLAFQ